jgi:predicted TIM-barrel fold metal-dependent hydrolase
MTLIDAHLHLGPCRVFDAEILAGDLIATLERNAVDKALVMPFPGAPDAAAVHDDIATLGRETGRVVGIVNLNPHRDRAAYAAEAERCVRELGFVALKLHTVGHAVDPMSRDGATVFEEATRLGVPVMIHTGGVGEPFASPSHCLPLARRFPETKVVLAHAGGGISTREAGIVAAECDNVWLETSWCSILDLLGLVDQVGALRLMMGSDSLENLPLAIEHYRSLGLDDEALGRCLGGTAAEVFGV